MSDSRVIGLALMVLVLISVPSVSALTEDEVRTDLMRAYEAVVRAEAAGGHVTDMVSQLNDIALKLPNATPGSLESYRTMIAVIIVKASSSEASGRANSINQLYEVTIIVLAIVVLSLLILAKGSHMFWAVWARAHRGWKIERA